MRALILLFTVTLAALAVVLGPAALTASAQMVNPVDPQQILPLPQPVSVSPLEQSIYAIRLANNPDTAAGVYQQSLLSNIVSPELHQAYVRKMVDLGRPDDAYCAANETLTIYPSDGLAWAVVAHVEMQNGRMVDALRDIVLAQQRLPSSPLINRTAGQLLAWYDSLENHWFIPNELIAPLVNLRQSLGGNPIFQATYQSAMAQYRIQPPTRPLQ